MTLKLNTKFTEDFISADELKNIQPMVDTAHKMLTEHTGPGSDFHGWMDLPVNYDRAEFSAIQAAAKKIQKSCQVFIVIGIGGSYLGSRAVIEFIKSTRYNSLPKDTPNIFFAGKAISASATAELLQLCEDKDVCINVISKSGTTTEPAIAFRIFRDMLEKKYGVEGARERIFVTTDRAKGTLKAFADQMGYQTFVVPDDIGGRFSVMTAVGLLPIAVAGIDIAAMMQGAAEARAAYTDPSIDHNDCYRYAAIRNILYRKGKTTEILCGYEPYQLMFCEWWKQLFGESEGKDQKGIYPSSVIFSTDLHSLGQYIQDGMRNLFETVLDINDTDISVEIPYDPANIDGLNFLAGKQISYVNATARLGTLFAHTDGGVPNMVIELDGRTPHSLGYLMYFFELACAISGYMLGVNPFNQPGVEAYKKNMFALLGKAGYEDQKAALEARMM